MRSSLTVACGFLVALASWTCGGGGGGSPSGPSPSGAVTINVLGERGVQSFSPNPATAAQGSMVQWRNTDGQIHRIVANDNSFDTGDIAPSATGTAVRMATDGTNYHCSIHPTTMFGSINASSGAPPPCSGIYCE